MHTAGSAGIPVDMTFAEFERPLSRLARVNGVPLLLGARRTPRAAGPRARSSRRRRPRRWRGRARGTHESSHDSSYGSQVRKTVQFACLHTSGWTIGAQLQLHDSDLYHGVRDSKCCSKCKLTRSPTWSFRFIPGNHDWYDGLDTFMHCICGRHWFAGRHLPQTRQKTC